MVGINVKPPKKTCRDKKCPFHGSTKVRGNIIIGRVVSDKMKNTVVVEREFLRYVPKYEQYERRKTKVLAHNPECIGAKTGDIVKIMETRPLSKTKSFTIVEKR